MKKKNTINVALPDIGNIFFAISIPAVIAAAVFCNACQPKPKETIKELLKPGLYINYKYPLYLRDCKNARYVQTQIAITAIQFYENDNRVWVQFRLGNWEPFQPEMDSTGNWFLGHDSLPVIPLAHIRDSFLVVGNDWFQKNSDNDILNTAYQFYAGDYVHNNRTVYLYPSGTIIGLDSFVEFRPIIDYRNERGEGDRILLRTAAGKWSKFEVYSGFESKLLEIFQLQEDKRGKRIYQMWAVPKPIVLDI